MISCILLYSCLTLPALHCLYQACIEISISMPLVLCVLPLLKPTQAR